jgi:hypothetical protein
VAERAGPDPDTSRCSPVSNRDRYACPVHVPMKLLVSHTPPTPDCAGPKPCPLCNFWRRAEDLNSTPCDASRLPTGAGAPVPITLLVGVCYLPELAVRSVTPLNRMAVLPGIEPEPLPLAEGEGLAPPRRCRPPGFKPGSSSGRMPSWSLGHISRCPQVVSRVSSNLPFEEDGV